MAPIEADGAPVAPPEAMGGQPLEARLVDGVKEFALVVAPLYWHILPDVTIAAYAYNGQVPGPEIRLRPGERVRFKLNNALPEPTTIHWHGLAIDNAQDGVPYVTQDPVMPGESFAYEFTVPDAPGVYFYHTHFAADRQQPAGLFGALLIEDPSPTDKVAVEQLIVLAEHRVTGGKTYPAMEFDGHLPNYFTINGKSWPATEVVKAKVGDRVLLRFVGAGQFIHPMHVHGGPFEIVATDGYPVPAAARLVKDTVLVGPGERYDVVWTAAKPGKWLVHCHINHHITNDGEEVGGAGGLTMLIEVAP